MKFKRILAIVLSLTLLSACGLGQEVESSTQVKQAEGLYENTITETGPATEAGPEDAGFSLFWPNEEKVDSITYANIAFKEDDLFISGDGKLDFLPVSCVYEGKQILVGDFGGDATRLKQAARILSVATNAETLKPINVKEHMFADSNHPSYGFDWVATTGGWDLFPAKITYKTYDLEQQPDEPEWTGYFQALLEENGIDSPVIITESWTFQWDGVESVIVTATNAVPCENGYQCYHIGDEPIPDDLPANENPGIYLISALFGQGQHPFWFDCTIRGLPIETGPSYGLKPPTEVSDFYCRSVSAIQYDENGAFTVYPIYCGHVGTETMSFCWYPLEYLLCDGDGDGDPELTIYRRAWSSVYSVCQIWEFVDGGLVWSAAFDPFIRFM